jgi:hypothetical protein
LSQQLVEHREVPAAPGGPGIDVVQHDEPEVVVGQERHVGGEAVEASGMPYQPHRAANGINAE